MHNGWLVMAWLDPAGLESQRFNSSTPMNFQVIYHSNSGLSSKSTNFDDYMETISAASSPLTQEKPWWPYFNSREDFELAELMLEASLSQKQCNRLLNIIQKCAKGSGSVTLSSYGDMQSRWESASSLLTSVSNFPVYDISNLTWGYSFKRKLLLLNIGKLIISLTFIIDLFGSGLEICFGNLNWNLIGFGMPKSYIGLMVKILYASMMSHGLQIDFGKYRYISCSVYTFS